LESADSESKGNHFLFSFIIMLSFVGVTAALVKAQLVPTQHLVTPFATLPG
jgi:hypothetical protein